MAPDGHTQVQPLTRWTCDTCGNSVGVENGYVIWHSKNHQVWGFRIIHQKACDDRSHHSSLPLEDFLGQPGLIRLTSFLDVGEFHAPDLADRSADDIRVRDMADFVVFFRRVQIPFYEEARGRFQDSYFQQEVDGMSEIRVYQADVLSRAANGEFDAD